MKQLIIMILGLALSFNLLGQINDSIPFPSNSYEDVRLIRFYENYKSKSSINVRIIVNSSPDNNGKNWYTIYAEGKVNWKDETTLNGKLKILFDSRTKVVGSLISEIFKEEIKEVELEINATNGKINIKEDEFFVYLTEIKNNTIYGFNNSNKTLLITFETP